MLPHIQIKNVNVYYKKNQALKNVNVVIPRKQITVIMGPSGCGKTTLLRSLNRFLELDEGTQFQGEILIDNQNIYDPSVEVIDIRKRVGLLAQNPYPLPMSIFENVAYGIKIHNINNLKKDMQETVRHYLELAGLWEEVKDRLHSPAGELSVGQQQRLCLARGLAIEPEIILGDEPTSALDPISAQHIEKRLLELKDLYTIVIVTHILRQAKRLADYVIFMYLGEVVESGTADQVFFHPKQERTQAYINGIF
jgi:phosphate transport system ATP-binding protein